MPVEVVHVQLPVPKESKEIVDALSGLVEHFKNGGDLAGATAKLPQVMAAVDGWDKVGEEMKSEFNDEAAAYMLHKIMAALKGKPSA